MNPLSRPITASSAAIGQKPGRYPIVAIAAPNTELVATSSKPRRFDFTTPASNIPPSVPAATLEIHKPNAAGDEKRLFAIHASPTLSGPDRQKFSTAASNISERRATSLPT